MKAHELRAMTREELAQKIDELSQEMFNLRFQMATKQLNDTSRVRQVRRDIARAKMALGELERKAEVK
jgi:large subunit ribosomal protein L29